MESLKVHLVANGLQHIEGSEYNETFSPVAKLISIRLVLTIAISRGWKLQQVDISNAFLHVNLEERVVVSQPVGFFDAKRPHHV